MPKIIPYLIHLEEPTLVTALDGDPNSAVAFPYIPGSVLRGFFITRFMREYQLPELNAEDHAIRDLFFNGKTRFLNGYPFINGVRSLPTPLSWRTLKDDNTKGHDFALFDQNRFDNLKAQPARVGKPFYVGAEAGAYTFTPLRTIDIHTNRSTSRRHGRPREEAGAVYRYDALAKDQVFEASIVVDDGVDLNPFMPLLDTQRGYIGGARKSGYGKVSIEVGAAVEYESPQNISTGRLIVTLLSDLILRDSNGVYRTNHVALTEFLREQGLHIGIEATYDRAGLVGGFNRKWGLPLPQVSVLEMGSVYVYEFNGGASEILSQLALSGIGERRVDGFGQVGFNLWEMPEFTLHPLYEQPSTPKVVTLNDDEKATAQAMLQQIARNRLELEIQARANQLIAPVTVEKLPKSSQLAHLRTLIQGELLKTSQPTTLNFFKDFEEHVMGREKARTQFDRFRIGGKRFLEWVMSLSDAQNLIEGVELRVADVSFQGDEQMRLYYHLKLVDAVLALAIKQKREMV